MIVASGLCWNRNEIEFWGRPTHTGEIEPERSALGHAIGRRSEIDPDPLDLPHQFFLRDPSPGRPLFVTFGQAVHREPGRERITAGAAFVEVRQAQHSVGRNNTVGATRPRPADVDGPAINTLVVEGGRSRSHGVDMAVIKPAIAPVTLGKSTRFGLSRDWILTVPGHWRIGLHGILLVGRTVLTRLHRLEIDLGCGLCLQVR